jgi:phage-related protein
MATVTSLNYYSFAFNGFVFGGASSPYQILSVDGLESLPNIRNQDDNRGYADGMFSGNDFLSGRTITITVNTFAGGGNSAQTNYNLLQSNLLPQTTGTTPLQFQLSPSGGLQVINARVRTEKTVVDPNYTYGYITSQYSFFCPDPRYYDNTVQSASMTVSNPLGRTYPRVYPLTYGGGSVATTTNVANNGWATTYPTITLNGPITNPVLGNVTQGKYITIQGTFANTDTLVLNLDQKLITYNGNAARNLLAGNSNWFSAQPGTNQFYLTGSGTLAGTTAATVTWQNAYI